METAFFGTRVSLYFQTPADRLVRRFSRLQVDRLPTVSFRSDLGKGQVLRRGWHTMWASSSFLSPLDRQYLVFYSVRRLFRRHVDPPHPPPPTMCLVRFFSSSFHHIISLRSLFFFKSVSHHSVTPTNAHISGFQAQRQRQLTNCSILPKLSACTSTKARSCACG
jgi:hypothetical protein